MEIMDFLVNGTLGGLRLGMLKAEVLLQYPNMTFNVMDEDCEISNSELFEATFINDVLLLLQIDTNPVIRYRATTNTGDPFELDRKTSLQRYLKFLNRNKLKWKINSHLSFSEQIAVQTEPGTTALFSYDGGFFLESIALSGY